MNVVLVNPPLSSKYPTYISSKGAVDILHPPLGLALLAAVCESNGHAVSMLDLSTCPLEDNAFLHVLEGCRADVVGITAMTSTYPGALRYARLAHEAGILTVIGGPHVTFAAPHALATGWVDYVVFGEGELTFLELLACLEEKADPRPVSGIAYQQGDALQISPPRPRMRDLDVLPLPAYHLLDMSEYVNVGALGTATSRGCPHTCGFCSNSRMWGHQVTFRSPRQVIHELEHLITTYNYAGNQFSFYDDTFTLNQARALAICSLMRERDMRLHWKCMTRVDNVNARLLENMRAAGCYRVIFGIECVTNESLQRVDKGFTVDQAKHAVRLARAAGLETEGYFIIGLPWQTRDDLMVTVHRLREFELDSVGLALLTPYPGTSFYEQRIQWHLSVEDSDWERFTTLLPVVSTPHFSQRDLAEAFVTYLADYHFSESSIKDEGSEATAK